MNKIYVVGIGPGAYEKMTIEAAEALKDSDTIIGYTVYVDLVKDHFPDKRFLTTPMTKEVDRCVLAFEEAKKGHVVSISKDRKNQFNQRCKSQLMWMDIQIPFIRIHRQHGIVAVSEALCGCTHRSLISHRNTFRRKYPPNRKSEHPAEYRRLKDADPFLLSLFLFQDPCRHSVHQPDCQRAAYQHQRQNISFLIGDFLICSPEIYGCEHAYSCQRAKQEKPQDRHRPVSRFYQLHLLSSIF